MKKLLKILFVLLIIFIIITVISAVTYGILDLVTWIQFISTETNNDVMLFIRKFSYNIGIISFMIAVLLGVLCYLINKKT